MSDKKVSDPQGLVSIGDEIEVKIIRLDASNRKLGLSMKRAAETTQEEGESGEETLQETEK